MSDPVLSAQPILDRFRLDEDAVERRFLPSKGVYSSSLDPCSSSSLYSSSESFSGAGGTAGTTGLAPPTKSGVTGGVG